GRNGDGSAIDDAKYLWENVTVSNWTGGDFLRADLTRNSPEALRFLELEKPEVWYESDAFKNSDDADELRTILAALRTSSPPEGTPFGREFVEALAESSEQLISADLNQLDSVAVEFLERQRAKLQDIPANDRLEWTTPADGRRAAVLFNTISELSRTGTAPPERRIRTWEDVFSDGIANATSAAAGRSSDPVVVLQWNLMKPIDTWASSAR
ncbi:MAG: hypothetical protein KA250_17910, partial [Verrucomicrobiales bacterium]|nr:hypothetical protein [Verrucomicrobiales bacterium]